MNRKLDFEIKETESDLKKLLLKEKDTRLRERIQFIYLIKSKEVTKIAKATKILSRDRRTLGNWIKKYESGGLENLLERNTSKGRPSPLSIDKLDKLREKLGNEEGFKSYKHIQEWISTELNINLNYAVVFNICSYKLGAKPKVSRPKNPKQDKEKLNEFKKKNLKKL